MTYHRREEREVDLAIEKKERQNVEQRRKRDKDERERKRERQTDCLIDKKLSNREWRRNI